MGPVRHDLPLLLSELRDSQLIRSIHSELMACHELGQLLDEDLTEAEKTELEEAEAVCRAFVAWNLDKDATNVKDRLAKVLDIGR